MDNTVFQIAFCDDEPEILEYIKGAVRNVLEQEGVPHELTCFQRAAELLDALSSGGRTFDLFLLDVMMEGLDGIELAGQLRGRGLDTPIIFISSNPNMAMRGYEVDASRYLGKPVDQAKLREALLFCLQNVRQNRPILISTSARLYRLSPKEILYIEVYGRGTQLITRSGPLESRTKISEYEKLLPSDWFFRCHQGFLVNMNHITAIVRYELTLSNGQCVPVSKQRYLETRSRFLAFLSA